MLPVLVVFVASLAQVEPLKIAHTDDETSLVRVKADPTKFFADQFIISGIGTIDDYYNYGYRGSKLSHTNIEFVELGDDTSTRGESAHLYAHRIRCKEAINQLVETLEKNKGKVSARLMRVKVAIAPDKFYDGERWDMLEVKDIQFAVPNTNPVQWQPWIVEAVEKKQRVLEDEMYKARDEAMAKAAAAEKEKRDAKLPQLREWADDSGKFNVKAKFAGVIGGKVRLRKEDGSIVSVTISKLRKVDQDYVKSRAKQ